MPGYAARFPDFWDSRVALRLVDKVGLAKDLERAGREGLGAILRQDHVRYQERSLRAVLTWAATAASPDAAAATHREIALALNQDGERKEREIQGLERRLATMLIHTPYVVLMSICGINVVSAAEYAGEMGPITRYANPKTITGRAGLYPSRAQSDEVDHPDGPLLRCANRRLRFTILQIADNLIACNRYFSTLNKRWKAARKDPRHCRVCVASRFARISYHMVAARQVFRHPMTQDRSYILQKLMEFHRNHGTPVEQTLADLQAAVEQLPRSAYAAEAVPLAKELETVKQSRRRGPQPIGEILPVVLAQLGIARLQSAGSGERDPT
jgi:hypothetical protein